MGCNMHPIQFLNEGFLNAVEMFFSITRDTGNISKTYS